MTRILVLVPVLLSGCTMAARIEHDVVDFNRAVEATSNEIAFSNILRSYKRMPRHYTAISTLQGNLKVVAGADVSSSINPGRVATDVTGGTSSSGTTTVTAAGASTVTDATSTGTSQSATFVTSPDTYTPKLSGSVTSNPNYSVGVLESQEFYQGLLKPIDLNTIALYSSQGWSSELLWNVFIEGIWFEFPDGSMRYLENDPLDPNWTRLAERADLTARNSTSPPSFIADGVKLTDVGIAKLYEAGLTVQTCAGFSKACSAPPKNCDELEENGKGKCAVNPKFYIATKGKSAVTLRSSLAGAPDGQFECREEEKSVDPDFSSSDVDDESLVRLFLLNEFDFGEPSAVPESFPSAAGSLCSGNPLKATLVTRSTDGIVYYIGEYLRAIGTIDCTRPGAVPEILISGDPMFRICPAKGGHGRLTAVVSDEEWAIPEDSARIETRSMQVLGLVQQLVNLNKVSKDLPKPTFIQVN